MISSRSRPGLTNFFKRICFCYKLYGSRRINYFIRLENKWTKKKKQELLLRDRWYKVSGNVPTAEPPLPNCRLSPAKDNLYTAANAIATNALVALAAQERLLTDRWFKATGNVRDAEKLLPNCRLNQVKEDQSIAEIASATNALEVLKEISNTKTKTPRTRGVLVL